jgi:putative MFS transporter
MPLSFLVGKMLDVWGRHASAIVIFGITAAGVFGSYTLHSYAALTAALVAAVFGLSAVLPVLNAYNNELFPTELRGDAFAWSNNLLGRITYVTSPILIANLQSRVGWGWAVAWTAVFPLFALALILKLLPETRGRELEETSALTS